MQDTGLYAHLKRRHPALITWGDVPRETHVNVQTCYRNFPLWVCLDFLLSRAVFGSSFSIKGKWEVMGSKGENDQANHDLWCHRKRKGGGHPTTKSSTCVDLANDSSILSMLSECGMTQCYLKPWIFTPFIKRGLKEIYLHKTTWWMPPLCGE